LKATRKDNAFQKVRKFFLEVWSEMNKVLWPSKQEIVNNTVVVMGVLFAFGAGVWVLDAVFRRMVGVLGLF